MDTPSGRSTSISTVALAITRLRHVSARLSGPITTVYPTARQDPATISHPRHAETEEPLSLSLISILGFMFLSVDLFSLGVLSESAMGVDVFFIVGDVWLAIWRCRTSDNCG